MFDECTLCDLDVDHKEGCVIEFVSNVDIKINFDEPIVFNAGWNCCNGNETHVLVFDNGARWAICACCSYAYSGPVYSLFIFNPSSFRYNPVADY